MSRTTFKIIPLYVLALLATINIFHFAKASDDIIHHPINLILKVDIHSTINPSTLDYLRLATKKAREKRADMLLIGLNTPGGLVSTTKDILALIGESDIPVAIWIGPEGASATSAGAIIASAAHILVMSEGTNIGAATPIQMSGDIEQKDLRNKAINDLVALVQSLSESRGRNPKHYADMIEKSSSFKSRDAVELGLVDTIINNNQELYDYINDRTVVVKGVKKKLSARAPAVENVYMSIGQELLNVLANPSFAYILLLAGAALIYLEFQAPGGFIAGGVGAVCLMIVAISFQVLPLNIGALGLIILGFILFIAEIYITSFGVISIIGLVSLTTGSIFLFRGAEGHLHINPYLIASVVTSITLFLAFVANIFLRGNKKIGKTHFNSTVGKVGIVVEKDVEGQWPYQVRVNAENWRAHSEDKLELHDKIIVNEEFKDTMSLSVKKL